MNLFHSMSSTVGTSFAASGALIPQLASSGGNKQNGLTDVIIGYRRANTNQRQYLNKVMA